MNLNLTFLDVNSSPLTGKKALFTPQAPPNQTASYLSVGDSYQYVLGTGGTITASIVPATYKVEITTPTPATSFYLVATETGSYIYSGSFRSGSAQCVYFDLLYLTKSPFATKKLQLTPQWNYPVDFSGSIIALCATSSLTDSTGSVYFNSLVPGPYLVDAFGKIDTSWYISVPAWPNTASLGPCWNGADLRIVKPSKAIPVKLSNADMSYVLTVSASDARYFRIGDSGSVIYSASYAQHATIADTASFVVNAASASYVPNLYPQEYLPSASWASSSISASYSETASYAANVPLTASNADTASFAFNVISASHADFADRALSASYAPASGVITNAETASLAYYALEALSASWAPVPDTASYALQALSASYASNVPETASYANQALSASWAPMPTVSNSSSWASSSVSSSVSVSSSYADTASYAGNVSSASYATSASYANTFEVEVYTIYASYAITSSFSETASYVSASNVVGAVSLSLNANTASFVTASNVVGVVDHSLLADTASYFITSSVTSASYVPNLYPQVPQDTVPSASWVSESVHILNADTASYFITSSVTSASYAESASYVPNLYPQVAQITVPSASWVSASVHITNADTASYFITSSVTSASYAPNLYPQEYLPSASWASASLSASYAVSASYVPNLYPQVAQETVPSASWVSASVHILNADTASYFITSSVTSASYVPNLYPQITQDTVASASWVSASVHIANADTASYFITSSVTSASYAVFADRSVSASYAPQSGVVTNAETASYVLQAVSASYAPQTPFPNSVASASWVSASAFITTAQTASHYEGNVASASWASSSISASYAPFVTSSVTSASYAISASYAPTVGGTSDSASWASSSISASHAISASYAPFTQTVQETVLSASWVSASVRITTADTASYFITSSVTSASYSVSASWAPMPVIPSTDSASWASSSISASHAVRADTASRLDYGIVDSAGVIKIGPNAGLSSNSTSGVQIGNLVGQFCVSASTVVQVGFGAGYGSSLADQAVQIGGSAGGACPEATNAVQIGYTAGYDSPSAANTVTIGNNAGRGAVPTDGAVIVGAGAKGSVGSIAIGYLASASINQTVIGTPSITSAKIYGTLDATGSLNGTASYAVSASWSPSTGGVTPGASYDISASWASASISASVAISASYVPNLYPQEYLPSASWASSSISASYVPNLYPQEYLPSASWASASISASYVPNLYPQEYLPSASWASASISASNAGMANAISFIPQVAVSASWVSASVRITNADTASYLNAAVVSASWASASIASQTAVVATSASWSSASIVSQTAVVATSASFASASISASYAPFTQTTQVSCSWASASYTASYISQSIGFPTAVNGYFPYFNAYTLTTSSRLSTDGVQIYGPVFAATSSISAQTAVVATSASWASASIVSQTAVVATSASWASASIGAITASYLSGSAIIPTSSSIYFHTASIYSQSGTEGRVFWDAQDNTLAVCCSPNVTQQVGQEVMLRVCANENIYNGQVLYATTNSFNNTAKDTYRQVVGLAIADGTGLRSNICGVATEDIPSGSRGFMTMIGDIHGVDTNALTQGAYAYLSTTASGSMTATRPLPPYEQVVVGLVTHKDATNGIVSVNVANPPDTSFVSNAGMTNLPTLSSSISASALQLFVSSVGTVNLYNNISGSDTVKNYFLAGYTGSLANTGSTYYLVASYGSGVPAYDLLTSSDTINNTTITNVATVIRPIYKPTGIEYLFHDQFGYALANKLNQRAIRTERFAHETGLTLAESASRVPTISAGAVWFGGSRIATNAVNGALNTYRLFTTNTGSSTGWSSSVVTQYNNNQYDDGNGSLVVLSGAGTQYAVNFIFRSLAEGDNDLYSVLGRGNYSLAQAQASTVPSPLPAMLSPSAGLAVLVGRIIVAQGATTAYSIESAWTTTFQASAGTDHNALSNLQGGAAGEYYHLTATDYQEVVSNTSSVLMISSSANTTPLVISSNVNDFCELYLQNINTGSQASTDIALTNDIGTTITYYTDVGINGSKYTASFVGCANDGYLFHTGSQSSSLYIGNLDATGSVYLFAGGYTATGSGVIVGGRSVTANLPFTASTILGTTVQASAYQMTQSYSTVYGAPYTISNADNGKLIVMTGSANTTVTLTTTNIDGGWSAMFCQSGSGAILFTTSSTAVFLRSYTSKTGSAGQYAVVSAMRLPSGDFVLGGGLA